MIGSDVIYGEIPCKALAIDERELAARLGYMPKADDALVNECKEELLGAVRPSFCAKGVSVSYPREGAVLMDDREALSLGLYKSLYPAKKAFLISVTLGIGADRCLARARESGAAKHFVLDAVASALAEAAVEYADRTVTSGKDRKRRFSPGYGDLPLSFSSDILELTGACSILGISRTASALMLPTKSVTAIVGFEE